MTGPPHPLSSMGNTTEKGAVGLHLLDTLGHLQGILSRNRLPAISHELLDVRSDRAPSQRNMLQGRSEQSSEEQ